MEVVKNIKDAQFNSIPEEWKVLSIQELIDNNEIIGHLDGNHGALYPRSHEFSSFGIPYITANDFETGVVDFTKVRYLPYWRAKQFQKGISIDGDVLFAHNATVGPTALLRTNYEFVILSTTATYFRTNHQKLDNKFFCYLIQSPYFVSQYKAVMGQSTRNQVPITQQRKLNVVLPPLPEQKAIAEVLSDTDKLIQSLEKQIAKKRLIKQGAMQKSMSPKKGWKEYIIDDIGRTYGGLSGKSKSDFQDGNYPYIPFMNVMSNPKIDIGYLNYVKLKTHESQNKALKGDLFFNGSSETPEEVGMCSVLTVDLPNLYLNSFCFGFRLNKECKHDGLFLSYYFRSDYGRNMFYSLAQGATRYNLSKSNFLKMKLFLPPPEDQLYIANILTDIDAEIELLKKKLNKYKSLKKGLMQNLLTGKIRLKQDKRC